MFDLWIDLWILIHLVNLAPSSEDLIGTVRSTGWSIRNSAQMALIGMVEKLSKEELRFSRPNTKNSRRDANRFRSKKSCRTPWLSCLLWLCWLRVTLLPACQSPDRPIQIGLELYAYSSPSVSITLHLGLDTSYQHCHSLSFNM